MDIGLLEYCKIGFEYCWRGLFYFRIGLAYCRMGSEYSRIELEYCIIDYCRTVRILQNRFGILQHRVRLLQSRGILQNRERKVGGTSKQSIHSVPFNFATRGNLWPKQNHWIVLSKTCSYNSFSNKQKWNNICYSFESLLGECLGWKMLAGGRNVQVGERESFLEFQIFRQGDAGRVCKTNIYVLPLKKLNHILTIYI